MVEEQVRFMENKETEEIRLRSEVVIQMNFKSFITIIIRRLSELDDV